MIEVRIKPEFALGEQIKIKNNPAQVAPMVTDYKICPLGITYGVSYNGGCSWHYANELEHDPNSKTTIGFQIHPLEETN